MLVHGFASSFRANWEDSGWVDLLRDAGREVIALDLPGHGGAAGRRPPATYDQVVDAVEAVLPGRPVDAVGFSFGARLLLASVARSPSRYRRVVVSGIGDGVLRSGDPAGTEALARAIDSGETPDGLAAPARAIARFARAGSADAGGLAALLRIPEEPLSPLVLAAVAVPVLVVLGDRDFAGPGEGLAGALGDARLETIRGLDHFATPRDPRVMDAAFRFLGV